jgi:hypothetical protein
MASNGLKMWLIRVGTSVLLAYSAWLGLQTVELSQRLVVQETKTQMFENWLKRVEDKLDQVIENR